MLTSTVPWELVPLIQAMSATLPAGAVLTAAIHACAPCGGLTWVAALHPVAAGLAGRSGRWERGWPGGAGSGGGAGRTERAVGRLGLRVMDNEQARERLLAERAEVLGLLQDTEQAAEQDRQTEDEQAETGDAADAAQPLAAEGLDDSVAETLRDRLAALDRALKRLDDGTYGRSVRSGAPIPPERLEADPAAELTIEEARAGS